MKNLVIVLAVLMSVNLTAQHLNDKGLYVNSDNELFSGVLSVKQNGVNSKFEVKEGVINGSATYYFESGAVMETGTFTAGKKDKEWIRYNENGTIAASAFYLAGKKSGTWIVYDDKGKKRYEMSYINGEKTGTWMNWDENGVVINTKDYTITN